MAKGVKGLWARLGTVFILTDARFVGRSDGAQALFLWLVARALDYHGEFLPLEYSDPKTIAKLRGRTLKQTKKAIADLTSAVPLRSLVGIIGQNRIRVCGQREKHGNQIGWRNEQSEAAEWNELYPDAAVDPLGFTEYVPAGRPRKDRKTIIKRTFNDSKTIDKRPTTEEVKDVDVKKPQKSARLSRRKAKDVPLHEESDNDKDNSIKAPDGVVPEDWWRLLRLTAEWPTAGKTGGLVKLTAILKANGPADAEAWIGKADRGWKDGKLDVGPWAVLARGFEPLEKDRGGGNGSQRKTGEPEGLGAILDRGKA